MASELDYRDPEWVAERLGIDKNAVYRYLQDGTLVGLRLGRKWLISERQLAGFLAQEAQQQTEQRRKATSSVSRTMVRLAKDYAPDARRVIELAHAKANELGHEYLGQEHLLLGMADSADCPAASLLARLGVRLDALREAVSARVAPGNAPPSGRLARTAPAKRAMRLAVSAGRQDGREAAGSEDILLGVLQSGEGIGFEVLSSLGATLDAARRISGDQSESQ